MKPSARLRCIPRYVPALTLVTLLCLVPCCGVNEAILSSCYASCYTTQCFFHTRPYVGLHSTVCPATLNRIPRYTTPYASLHYTIWLAILHHMTCYTTPCALLHYTITLCRSGYNYNIYILPSPTAVDRQRISLKKVKDQRLTLYTVQQNPSILWSYTVGSQFLIQKQP
jgi:hypothetical protein